MIDRKTNAVKNWLLWAWTFGVLLLVGGCGGRAEVTGIVTYRGKPLTMGVVTFIAENGDTGSASINSEGFYQMRNAPWGNVKATVEVSDGGKIGGTTVMPGPGNPGGPPGGPSPPTPGGAAGKKDPPKTPTPTAGPEGNPPLPKPPAPVKIDLRYRSPATSGLSYVIDASKKRIDIELK